MKRLVFALSAVLACASDQRVATRCDVQQLDQWREHQAKQDASHREALAHADARAIEPFSAILALDALHKGDQDCAVCLLEGELNSQLKRADDFLAADPPQSALDTYNGTINYLRSYRQRHPWNEQACKGVCSSPR